MILLGRVKPVFVIKNTLFSFWTTNKPQSLLDVVQKHVSPLSLNLFRSLEDASTKSNSLNDEFMKVTSDTDIVLPPGHLGKWEFK